MPKARKSPLSNVTFAHELVGAVGDVEVAAASTSPSTSSRGPTIQEASLALLSTHVQQQVQDAVKELDEADLAESNAMTACGTEIDSYDVAERVFHVMPVCGGESVRLTGSRLQTQMIRLRSYYKIQQKWLKAQVRMLTRAWAAAAYSAGCVARDAANKAQSVELHALRRLLVHDNNINSHKRKKVA